MKFDRKVHGIKTQPKFNFRVCRSKVKGHSSFNMQKHLIIYVKMWLTSLPSNIIV